MAEYAGIGSRIVAIIIDHIILWIIAIIIAIPMGMFTLLMGSMVDVTGYLNLMTNIALWTSYFAINFIITLIYFTYLEGTSGQTVGKKLVNIKVVKENGKKLNFSDAFVRTILRIIDGLFIYILGFIIILVTEKKQRVGDLAARTIVVRA